MVDFFNRINLAYGIISEYCTRETCPTMSGGPRYEYRSFFFIKSSYLIIFFLSI